jgi:hypothetical protein
MGRTSERKNLGVPDESEWSICQGRILTELKIVQWGDPGPTHVVPPYGPVGPGYVFSRMDPFPERIYDITYHISSSPYCSEDIHTDYLRVSLAGVMTQG